MGTSASASAVSGRAKVWGFPPQIKYIIGNEAAERFSYYGMRSILVVFMIQNLLMAEHDSKGVYHTFVSACYFLPLFGGFLSDRYLGKYKSILYLSLFYCIGHLVLSLQENKLGLYAGLAFIALGSGGIKPCISAHVGDQFTVKNQSLIEKVYELFYWSVNVGATLSTLLIPKLLVLYGPGVAFAIPGVLMGVATLIFWIGRKHYVIVPPTGKEKSAQFFAILFYSVANVGKRKKGQHFLDVAARKYEPQKIEGAKAALNVFKVFAWVIIFWSLFDQNGSTWVIQAQKMNRNVFGTVLEASQMAAMNPILVMAMIPLFSFLVYPFFQRMGVKTTPLRKMSTGMCLAGFSFVLAGLIEVSLEAGHSPNVLWQTAQYVILTAAEIMVSIVGLEFAYTQAPRSMKSTIMSLWLLTVAFGNMITAFVSYLNPFDGAMEMFFYAGMMFIVAVGFIFTARSYKETNFVEPESGSTQLPTSPEAYRPVAGAAMVPNPQ